MIKNLVDIITMGCSKNLVDSEILIGMFEANGYQCRHDSKNPQGEIAVVNTCGFIGDAKEESINTILTFAKRKSEGRLKKLFVMGCLSERYMKELGKEIPQVDRFYGKFDWDGIVRELSSSQTPKENVKIKELNNVSSLGEGLGYERVLTTPRHYAYVKISEGCDRKCAYCAIPIITGRHHSRPIDDIIAEVEYLVAQGVREFQVIAQELTYYGIDLYKKRMIAPLIDRMAQVKGVKWIRLHYAYPHQFPMELLDVMRRHRNVCRYLDIALQHISTNVLTNMRRHVDKEQTYKLMGKAIGKLQRAILEAAKNQPS